MVPLLAIAAEIKKRDPQAEFLFIGTRHGIPERELAQATGLPYHSVYCGKLRRYFHWRNIFDPILLTLGIVQSIFIIKQFKPNIILSTGSFVSVPLVWAGWLLRVPNLIHQQDVVPSLSNIIMSPVANKITVSLEKSLVDFPKKKIVLTGNSYRLEILEGSKIRALKEFDLDSNVPTLLVMGGGTGAQSINKMIYLLIPELTNFCQIIHLTGKDKNKNYLATRRYHPYEFLTKDLADAFAISDLIISRAGMSTLTELSILAKPTILIPIPDSHQEANAKYFADKKAVYVLWQKYLTAEFLLKKIKEFILNPTELEQMSQNIGRLAVADASQKVVDQIYKICYNK